jgi:hypothetical protein
MEIKKLFDLDHETGALTWKPRKADMFSPKGQRSAQGCCNNWNSRYAGKPCLTAIGSHGYRHGNVLGKGMLAHRVVFELYYGFAPDYVDHINGNKLDNRPSNLRNASNGQNIANSNSRIGSTSKYIGVCWAKTHKKWIANITSGGKCYHLGLFVKESDAAKAYNVAAKFYHGDYARPNVIDSDH